MNNGLSVRRIIFVNRAPFEKLDLKFIDGVNVLSSENGRGKTTIMSYIVDALHQMAKESFAQSYEGHETAWYRISSGAEVIDDTNISLVYIRFAYQEHNIDYIDLRGDMNNEKYKAIVPILPENPIPISSIMQHMQQGNMCKFCHFFDKTLKKDELFSRHIATYFPAYRYELPAYINEVYKMDKSPFNRAQRFRGYLPNPIEVITGIDKIADWLLDVVLDMEVAKEPNVDTTPEIEIWRKVCDVLGFALFAKKGENTIRFGIGRRTSGESRVSVIKEAGEQSELLSPSVSYLSSGEKGLLCIFGEILRQSDRISPNIQVNQIDGLVLVDEIDKHLHIRQQKEALPKLMDNFPNIQFILSSHSPFLNMGLADVSKVPSQIIDLDAGGVTCEPRQNELYSQVYEMMLNEKANFVKQVEDLRQRLAVMTKTVVITEGKTDIMHINKAKEKLGITLDYDVISPENQPDGEKSLMELLKQVAKTPNEHKIIGVFDCDTDTTKDFDVPYQSFGNNVYAFKIQSPKARIDNGQSKISIEYLYSDDEVKMMLPNGTRLFFGAEFSKRSGMHAENPGWVLANQSERGKDKIVENEGGQAVYDSAEKNYLAKKSDFAQAVADETIKISDSSWENFRHIFDTIEAIVNL